MTERNHRSVVAARLAEAPVIGVVRTSTREQAEERAHLYLEAGLALVEITFTVPRATEVVRALGPAAAAAGASVGMGTVTTAERAERAVAAGAEFLVAPNTSAGVAEIARSAGLYLVLGALTCTEIVRADELGADLIKVYPLPPVGGPAYLEVVRQPLSEPAMLAAGGFGVDEIPAYREAGAVAFGMGPTLVGADRDETLGRIGRALELARGGSS